MITPVNDNINIQSAKILTSGQSRLYISAYGFEDRTLGWLNLQKYQKEILTDVLMVRYIHQKGDNKVHGVRASLAEIGISKPKEWEFDITYPFEIEHSIEQKLNDFQKYEEIVLDISSL